MPMLPVLTPAQWVLEALLVTGAVIDWRTARLPNWLTLGGLAAGLAASVLPQGVGALDAALGAGSALALLLPLWLLGVTGAGDVKLMAMVGAFLGVPGVFIALLLTIVAGGVFAIGYAAAHGKVLRMAASARDILQLTAWALVNRERPQAAGFASVGKLPYGVCVCIGTSLWLAWQAAR